MAKVSLQSIARKYGNVTAIEDITFEIPDGEFWVLVGPSGCGKSTILRTIAGLEKATSGELYIGETLVNNIPARQRDVAMVFQNYALYPHMSVAENLAFGLKMRQESPTKINRRVKEVANALDIEHLLKRKPKQLSGGQQQRVALGRAISRQPQVFLLDEPLSNLDTQLRDDTRAELKQLHNRVGITTVYVTHDQVEAMTLGDRIVVLKDGKIQQIDTPQAIYATPANSMVASFLGSPPMNILPVIYSEGNLIVNNQSIVVCSSIKQQLQSHQGVNFDLGIRPEHLTIITENHSEQNNFLSVKITVIEPLGKEILLRTKLSESHTNLDLFAPPNWQGKIGETINVNLDLSKVFIFDCHSGQTIFYSQNKYI
jgi:multiple sugar transport system ATP-binding protein